MINKNDVAAIIILGAVTFLCFSPSLENKFTNWDDNVYVTENPLIKVWSWDNFGKIWSVYISNHYHPLTTISLSIDYRFFRLNAWGYHLMNVFFHLLNVFWVYLFMMMLAQDRAMVFLVALLFAIHPLHVESVAWISERKDVLYSNFYLLSLIFYLQYLKNEERNKRALGISVFLFLLSLLSKSMAVTLPLALCLLDFYHRRPFKRELIYEKVPFFILAVVFGMIALLAPVIEGGMKHTLSMPFLERVVTVFYRLGFYLVQTLIPLKLSCIYPHAFYGSKLFYAILAVIFIIIGGVFFRSQKKEYVFAGLFFIVSLLPVLQISSSADIDVFDRYMYIASIGIFLILILILFYMINRYPSLKNLLVILIFIYCVTLIWITQERIKAWHDTESLWTDVIQKYPNITIAYSNRGSYYAQNGNFTAALKDYEKLFKLDPEYAFGYNNRGIIFEKMGEFEKALADFNKAINLNHKLDQAYVSRANYYRDHREWREAIADYQKALEINPKNFRAYSNRGVLYLNQKLYDLALSDLMKSLALNPDDAATYNNLGTLYSRQGKMDLSLEYYSKAIALNQSLGQAFYNRSLIYQSRGEKAKAREDLQKAQSLKSLPNEF